MCARHISGALLSHVVSGYRIGQRRYRAFGSFREDDSASSQGSVGLCCFVELLRFYFLQNLRLELYSFFLVLLIDACLRYIEIAFAFGQVV